MENVKNVSDEEIWIFLDLLKRMLDSDFIDFGIKKNGSRVGYIYLDSFGWVQNGSGEDISFWLDFVQNASESNLDESDWE